MFKKSVIALGLIMAASAAFAELVVVVNPANNNQIDAKTVQRIFLGKDKQFADGSETIAVNQEASVQIR